jgi:hypothetical protein
VDGDHGYRHVQYFCHAPMFAPPPLGSTKTPVVVDEVILPHGTRVPIAPPRAAKSDREKSLRRSGEVDNSAEARKERYDKMKARKLADGTWREDVKRPDKQTRDLGHTATGSFQMHNSSTSSSSSSTSHSSSSYSSISSSSSTSSSSSSSQSGASKHSGPTRLRKASVDIRPVSGAHHSLSPTPPDPGEPRPHGALGPPLRWRKKKGQ